MTLPGLMVAHVRPIGILSVRLTTPAKLFIAITVIVDVAETPALTAAGEVADMRKSCTMNITVAEWFSEPLVPITVRV